MRKPKFDLELYGCGSIILATIAMFSTFAVILINSYLPLWAAVLIGVPITFIIFVALSSNNGNINIGEVSITCAIILVFVIILLPVFMRARQNAQREQMRQQKIQQMQKNNR